MRIYLASALTHVPQNHFNEYTDNLHEIALQLKTKINAEVLYALVNSDPDLATYNQEERAKLCYEWDRQMVVNSDLVIAESSFPSTGLGIEIQLAEQSKIPVIVFFKNYSDNVEPEKIYVNPDGKSYHLQIGKGIVSLMLLGNPAVISTVQYHEIEELTEKLIYIIEDMFESEKLKYIG